MHISHSIFAGAIERKLKLRITFFSKEDRQFLTRVCAPMDYGPSRRAKDQRDRYHMWDYDSDSGKPHPLAKFPEEITAIELMDDAFDPAEFVTWDLARSPWHLPREWGPFS